MILISAWKRGIAALGLIALGTAASAQERVEIDFWDMVWGPAVYSEVGARLVDEFNTSQDRITVTYRPIAWTNWYETYLTAIASGSAPDLSTGAGFQAVQLYDQGAIRPVDDLIEKLRANGTLDDFGSVALEAAQFDGHYVGLPWAMAARAWFYRKDLLAEAGIEPPETWEEMRTAAKAVTNGDIYGLVIPGDTAGMHHIFATTINNGGGLFDEDRKPAMTSQRNVEALEFLAGFAEDGSLHPASVGLSYGDARSAMQRGQAAFILAQPNFIDEAGDAGEDIGLLPPPKGYHGDIGTVFWSLQLMVYEQTEHPEETLEFLEWWSGNMEPLFSEGLARVVPARISHQQAPYTAGNENIQKVLDLYVPNARIIGAQAPGTFPELNEIEGDGFLVSIIQRVMQGEDPAKLAEEVQEHLEEVMN